jgi:hypothetical protein
LLFGQQHPLLQTSPELQSLLLVQLPLSTHEPLMQWPPWPPGGDVETLVDTTNLRCEFA